MTNTEDQSPRQAIVVRIEIGRGPSHPAPRLPSSVSQQPPDPLVLEHQIQLFCLLCLGSNFQFLDNTRPCGYPARCLLAVARIGGNFPAMQRPRPHAATLLEGGSRYYRSGEPFSLGLNLGIVRGRRSRDVQRAMRDSDCQCRVGLPSDPELDELLVASRDGAE